MSKPHDIDALQALFVGDDVEADELVRAFDACSEDDDVRSTYDELAFADRELGGDFEDRLGEALFLDALDEMLAEEADGANAQPAADVVSLAERRAQRPTPMYIAAAAMTLLGLGAVAQVQLNPTPEFQARSSAKTAKSPYLQPDFEVFCVERDGGEVRFVGQDESEFATVHCSTDQEIKLAIQNNDAKLKYAALVGVGSDYRLMWYGPSPAVTDAIPIEAAADPRGFGESIRLSVNHAPGPVRVLGFFSERPLHFADIRSFVTGHARSLRDGTLTIDRGVVVRHTFEVSTP